MRSAVETDIGTKGEIIVRRWLIENGYSIIPTSLINDIGAPMLLARDTKIILPDTLSWKDGVSRWVEIKTKSYPTEHETYPKRWEHGLPLRHWIAYDIIQQKTRLDVSIAILELSMGLLLLAPVNKLKAGVRYHPMERELHVFIARNDFHWFEIHYDLPEPIKPVATRTLYQPVPPRNKQLVLGGN